MSYPRYSSYKNSGTQWLGDVPAHWEIDRLKRSIVSAKNGIWGDEAQQDENDIPCVRVADFDRQALRVELSEPTIRNVAQKERVGRVLIQGDLLLEKSGGGESQPVGFVVLYDDQSAAVCSNFVARVQIARGMDSSFWRYLHAAAYAVRLNTKSIKQTSGIQNLDASSYFDERAVFPPYLEQTQIAAFLDRETAKIDDLAQAFEGLIATLKEKRQAVISHAVTKGLDPSVPMKDSGIEWLGEVPAHWEIDRIKRSTVSAKNGIWGDEAQQDENDIPCIRVADFDRQALRVELSEPTIRNVIQKERVGRVLTQGDLLLEKSGGGESQPVGCVVLYDDPRQAVCSNFVARVQIAHGMSSSFWRYVHAAAYAIRLNTKSIKQTSGIQNLDASQYFEERAVFPPNIEQIKIAAFLDCETAKLDALTAEAQRVIGLLQERRTALISAAVTGKIDVRGLVNVAEEEKSLEIA